MQIFVKVLNGVTITIEVELHETVDDLKSKIRDKEGIPRERQHLYFREKQLEGGQKLQYYKLKKGSNIMLLLSFGDLFQVFVKTLSGKTITLQVTPSTKVEGLKASIEDREGSPANELRLVYKGRYLQMEGHFCITASQKGPLSI
jgi:ubiquitin C